MLPDLDHRRGTAAQAWGPLTRGFGRMVGRVSGGHRAGTHTLLAAVLVGPFVDGVLRLSAWLAVPVVALLVGLALVAWEPLMPGRWERVWPANLAVSLATGWVLVVSGIASGWLPLAVMAGWLAHVLGDAVTVGGVRLLMPFSRDRVSLTRLRTGGAWESVAGWVLGWATVLLAFTGAR